ncbi:MAG: GntR family transcriptional regulator [Peptostreptococcus porci]|uniref:GntR family transcriptional regulator n=1 Tax=Peptostreptococcus porci TaxID=2652282 RepID=UPI002A8358F7|nr:GntR family transcriptional regulator [Peptostreptococcus porci]MDY4128411.1 GntR family transcriptional regulator [Peptostreptococcus porci]MDY4561087.1 GntR family transcriptional regulator [Peptostreptococcus porci]
MYKSIIFNNNSPIYLQITKNFEAMVFVGKLVCGDVIPSRRELAAELKVNLNTVQKAYSYMEDIGLICTEKNRLSKITSDLSVISELKKQYIKEPVIDFIRTMKSINTEKKEVIQLIDYYYDNFDEICEGGEIDDTSKKLDEKI